MRNGSARCKAGLLFFGNTPCEMTEENGIVLYMSALILGNITISAFLRESCTSKPTFHFSIVLVCLAEVFVLSTALSVRVDLPFVGTLDAVLYQSPLRDHAADLTAAQTDKSLHRQASELHERVYCRWAGKWQSRCAT